MVYVGFLDVRLVLVVYAGLLDVGLIVGLCWILDVGLVFVWLD